MLSTKLPAAPGEPLPQLSGAVVLTHLRTEATATEVDASLDRIVATTTRHRAARRRRRRQNDPPRERLSILIETLNERFGMSLTDADKVWFEQQKQAVLDDQRARLVALTNDRDQFAVFLDGWADDAIAERHDANGLLFNAYFEKPRFREALLAFLGGAYDQIRDERAG